jgi:hypothetical protein
MTATELVLRWVETALARNEGEAVFPSHVLQTSPGLPSWAEKHYDETYTPSTYMRRFREVKADPDALDNYNIADIVEVPNHKSNESKWRATAKEGRIPRDHGHRAPSASGS